MNVAGDVDGIGRSAKTEDLRVETNRNVDVIVTGQEEHGVARRAEFTVLLNRVDLVDLLLNGSGGHGWIEDKYVGTEVGSLRSRRETSRRESKQRGKNEDFMVGGHPRQFYSDSLERFAGAMDGEMDEEICPLHGERECTLG